MTTESTQVNTESSGSNDPNASSNQGQESTQNEGKVAYETYRKVLGEAKNAKEKLRALEAEFTKEREAKMKSNEDWKGLLELREAEIKDLRAQQSKLNEDYQSLDSHIKTGKKLSAVLNKIEGQLDQKYFGLIDLDDVVINPETGDIDDMSATQAALKYKTQYPETIKKGGYAGMMGDGRSSGTNGATTISRDSWIKLPYREQLKWKHSQIV